MAANDAVPMRLVMAVADEILAPVNYADKIASVVHLISISILFYTR